MIDDIKKAYDQWSKSYDSDLNKTRDLDELAIKNYLRNEHFNNVLELGCGTGKNSRNFSEHCEDLFCVDLSNKMLNKAKAKIELSKVQFQQFDICQPWTFTQDKFDLISCSLILEHIYNIDFIFHQAKQKLESEGRFIVSEFHPFKQYLGSQARFTQENSVVKIPAYVHHVSEFLNAAKSANLSLIDLIEYFDKDNPKGPPRILFMEFKATS